MNNCKGWLVERKRVEQYLNDASSTCGEIVAVKSRNALRVGLAEEDQDKYINYWLHFIII